MCIYLFAIGVKLQIVNHLHCTWFSGAHFFPFFAQAMKQWWQLKSDNFDTILFFKVLSPNLMIAFHGKLHVMER